MRLVRLQTVLSVGLAVKVLALLLAIIITGPEVAVGPVEVAAQVKAPAATPAAAKPAARQATPPPMPAATVNDRPQSYDPRLIKLMEARQQEIAREEARLARERKELQKLRAEVSRRIAELKKVQVVLEKLVKDEKTKREARIRQLVKVLSNMRPDAAAAVVAKLDDRMSVEIFSRMQSRQAGKLMAALKPIQAARISILLTKQQEARQAAQVAAKAARQGAQPPPAGRRPAGRK